jgi:hypothetical protein
MLIVELILWIDLEVRAARVYIGARPLGSEWAFWRVIHFVKKIGFSVK